MAKKKILIVDDDSRNIFALSAVLKAKGFSIVTADSVDEGFDLLRSQPDIGIVLSDIMLPGKDGFEFIEMVRKDSRIRSTPFIAITAQAMAGDREKCLAAGADGYLSKPIDVDKLIRVLQKHGIN
jgi:CheY-like chemotaxis protein